MRFLERITVLIFAVVSLLFFGTRLYLSWTADHTPPVLVCDSDVLEISLGASQDTLLSGVTASDNRDGDLTDQILIKGVSQLITADTAKVTYIVFDSSNNMATVQRPLRYLNYEKPRFSLSAPLVFTAGEQIRLLPFLSASDLVDGDLSHSIRVTNHNMDTSRPGRYHVTLQVTNSLGDTESLPVSVLVREQLPADPALTLSEYIVYLEQGDTFSPTAFILTPADPGSVEVESAVDPETPGTYEVSYTYRNYTVFQTVVVR